MSLYHVVISLTPMLNQNQNQNTMQNRRSWKAGAIVLADFRLLTRVECVSEYSFLMSQQHNISAFQ